MVTEQFDFLCSELLSIAGAEPYDSTDYQGVVDFHWGFDSLAEAQKLADILKHIAQRPEIVLLHIISRVDAVDSISLKDERWTKH